MNKWSDTLDDNKNVRELYKIRNSFYRSSKMKFVFCLNTLATLALPAIKLPDKLQNSTGISDAEIWDIYVSSINGNLIGLLTESN